MVVARDQVCRIKRGLRARFSPRNALSLGTPTATMRIDDVVGNGAMVRALKGPKPHKQGTNIHLSRGSMIQGCTRWFDPRFNARLAYRPANLPPYHQRQNVGGRSSVSGDRCSSRRGCQAMYAPCMPPFTCLHSLLARHGRVLSLLFLPPSGPELVLRQSHHLTKHQFVFHHKRPKPHLLILITAPLP